jgi:hypothetical protein
MKEVFEKLKGKSADITLTTDKRTSGPVIEVFDTAVGINTGTGIEYFSYRHIVSVSEAKKPRR